MWADLEAAGRLVFKASVFLLQLELKEKLLERVRDVEYFCNIKIKFWASAWLPGALPLSVSIRSSFNEGFWIPSGSDQHRIDPRPATSTHLSPEPLFRSELTSAVRLSGSFCFSDSLNSELRLQELWGIPELPSLSYISCLLHGSPCLVLSSLTIHWNLTSVIHWLFTFLL